MYYYLRLIYKKKEYSVKDFLTQMGRSKYVPINW